MYATENTKSSEGKESGKILGFPGGYTIYYDVADFETEKDATAHAEILAQEKEQLGGTKCDLRTLAFHTTKNRLRGRDGKTFFGLVHEGSKFYMRK